MAESAQRIIRLKRLDNAGDEQDYCLLSTTQTGKNPLDLKLVGTEGSEAFETTLTQAGAWKLHSSDFTQSRDVWEALLKRTLSPAGLEGPVETENAAEDSLAGTPEAVELCCQIKTRGKTKLFTVQWRSSGDTSVSFGSLQLPASADTAIELYDWLNIALLAQTTSNSALSSYIHDRNQSLKKMEERMRELVLEKKKYEEDLLSKVCVLLNEKKSKIRELMMVIADGGGAGKLSILT
jgi:DNA double-strand break repair and V(D)J recombination protein XRCC4